MVIEFIGEDEIIGRVCVRRRELENKLSYYIKLIFKSIS